MPILGLLLLLGAAFAAPPEPGAKPPRPTRIEIDTSPPIEMSKCAPCHRDLNTFKNPNLVNFNHPVHFKKGIRCVSCHIEWPHQKSQLVKPTMDLCMNCHRLNHSKQGKMAPGECALCHPPGFNLVPADHTQAFKDVSHKEKAAGDGKQACLNCHDGQFCRDCHAAKGMAAEPEDAYKISPILRRPEQRRWSKIVYDGKTIRMGSCNVCHTDLQRWKNEKLINFNHPVHFKKSIRCEACHTEWPHKPDEIVRPVMYSCAQCHRLSHSSQGQFASGECALCHPSGMNLRPDFHTTEFVGGDHKNWAKRDRGLCRICHRQSFCDACHQLNQDLVPHPPGWRGQHGTVAASPALATADGGSPCFRCHLPSGPQFWYQSAPSCAKCHKAVVYPHRQPWAPTHGKTAVSVGRDACYSCHKSETFCTGCHSGISLPHDPNTWIGEHRLFLKNNSIDRCLGCHVKSQCIQCHATHKVHNQHQLYDFSGLGR